MSDGPEVAVVGGGIAGLAAALAARRQGASVWLVDGPAGATALAGGAWDLASRRRDRAPTVAAPRSIDRALDDVARERPLHPWARLPRAAALGAIRASHDAVLRALSGYRALGEVADAELVATDLGLWRRTALAQENVLDLGRLPRARVAVAWMRGVRSFDGPFVAASLNEEAVRAGDGRRFAAVEVEMLRRGADVLLLPHEAAALFDHPDARHRAVEGLHRALGGQGFDAVLVPPVLGVEDGGAWAAAEAAVGLPVGEVVEALAGPQSLRLARRIRAALQAEGIVRRAMRVGRVALDAEGPHAELEGGETLHPGALVLATGKHVGGGITLQAGQARESLSELPVYAEGAPLGPGSRDPAELFGVEASETGAGFTLGVGWDAELRPLDVHGRPVSRDLFACGALLEGVAVDDGTGLGAACATGWLAGTAAARRALRV